MASLTGNEIGPFTDIASFQRRARGWYKDNLRSRSVIASDGAEVSFTRPGEGKSTTGKGPIVLRAIPAIEAIIAKGEHRGPFEPTEKAMTKGVIAEHRYGAAVSIAGQIHFIGVSVHERADGRRHYNVTNAEVVGDQVRGPEGRSEERSPNGIIPDGTDIVSE